MFIYWFYDLLSSFIFIIFFDFEYRKYGSYYYIFFFIVEEIKIRRKNDLFKII